ncbi:MAG: galactokinase [Eubacterium sp.]|nr:galactokinase [Eubacterium sp.]
MVETRLIKERLKNWVYKDLLLDIYVDESKLVYQTDRYIKAIEKYESLYGEDQVAIYSAPGRSEVGGNHTDHQHGEILAASINLDAIAITKKRDDSLVRVVSDNYDEIVIDTNDISLKEEEKESTTALIKGVLAGAAQRGYRIGGFQAYITSDVLIGAGLSSSAAFETIIGTIISYLYNDGKLDSVTNAVIGQYAENVYFGKPCGLMDQMACSVGSLVHVDFANPTDPSVEKVEFDMNKYGYSLCITDTKGSHADLTADYAAIPQEMKSVAAYFGKEVLCGIGLDQILANVQALRDQCGDRAVLRAIHFIRENERVQKEVEALKNEEIGTFLDTVKASGDSSFKFLQNVYTNNDVHHQNVSLALAVSEAVLEGGAGVCRVHGGGFAGTIQAFVKNDKVAAYREAMDQLFGKGACHVLKIRKYGGMKVIE